MAIIDIMTPEFWSLNTLQQLYKNSVMVGLVNRDFEAEVKSKGDTVKTRIPGYVQTRDVNTSAPFTAQEQSLTEVEIKLTRWVETVPMKIDDKTRSLAITDLIRLYIEPAAQSMLSTVETDLTSLYKDIPTFVGQANVVPADVKAFGTDPKQQFDSQMVAKDNRRVLLNATTSNSFGQRMWRVNETGSSQVLQNGLVNGLGRYFGSEYYDSQYLGQHMAGTWGTAPVTAGLNVAGASILSVTALGAHGQANHGDLFTINHGGNIGVVSYVVSADASLDANGAAILSISPALAADVPAGTALTAVGSHAVNVCFHRDSFTLASRPLELPMGTGALVSVSNFGGLGIRSTLWYEPKDRCHYATMDMLYGLKTIDRRKAFRLIG